MTRKGLTLKARVEAMEENALCPKCFKPFGGDVEYDHEIPLGLDGPDHDEKPMTPLHAECHSLKTKKDQADIARAKRRSGETGQRARREKRGGSSIQNRGFPSKEERAAAKAWKEERLRNE